MNAYLDILYKDTFGFFVKDIDAAAFTRYSRWTVLYIAPLISSEPLITHANFFMTEREKGNLLVTCILVLSQISAFGGWFGSRW